MPSEIDKAYDVLVKEAQKRGLSPVDVAFNAAVKAANAYRELAETVLMKYNYAAAAARAISDLGPPPLELK